MIHAESEITDRDHSVLITIDGAPDDEAFRFRVSPDQALNLAANLAGSTDIGAREFADELTEAAKPPDRCRCGHRYATFGGLCGLCSDAHDPRPDAA